MIAHLWTDEISELRDLIAHQQIGYGVRGKPNEPFDPAAWMADTRVVGLAARGAWMDVLCVMWRSSTRGPLTMPLAGYARLLGATVDQARSVIAELVQHGVCEGSVEGENTDRHGPTRTDTDGAKEIANRVLTLEANAVLTLACRRLEREKHQRAQGLARWRRWRDGGANGMPTDEANGSPTPRQRGEMAALSSPALSSPEPPPISSSSIPPKEAKTAPGRARGGTAKQGPAMRGQGAQGRQGQEGQQGRQDAEEPEGSGRDVARRAEAQGRGGGRFRHGWIRDLWNETMASTPIPKCRLWTLRHEALAAERLADMPNREDWKTAFEAVARSGFCRGEEAGSDGRLWTASLMGWALKRKTALLEILDGGGAPAMRAGTPRQLRRPGNLDAGRRDSGPAPVTKDMQDILDLAAAEGESQAEEDEAP